MDELSLLRRFNKRKQRIRKYLFFLKFWKTFWQRPKSKIEGRKELRRQLLFHRIRRLLVNEFKLRNEEGIKFEYRLKEDLGLDSIDAIQIIMVLECEFGFEIPDENIEEFETIGQIVKYILSRTS